MHQLTNDPFRSKIPLEFKAERLEEHPKPTGVEVEGLEILTGSPETDRLAYEEVIDSHRAPQHMNHIESKVIARRIQIEEPSRLVILRKLPEEILRIEMLKHAARIDALALEIFRGRTVSAINVLFEDSSSESTHALGVRTYAESPAMLTKRSHVTAQRVVAARTQVLHTDDSTVTGQLCRIAAIEEYEEWGEWRTVWKLPQLRAMATAAKATMAATRATAMTTTTTLLSADQWLGEMRRTVLWKQGAMSAGSELDSSKVGFDCRTFYLQLFYAGESWYMRRRPADVRAITVQGTTKTVALSADRRSCESGHAIPWRWGTTSVDTEPDGSKVCFSLRPFYSRLFYTRENGYIQRRLKDIQAIAIHETTTTRPDNDQRLGEIEDAVRWDWGARSADNGLDAPRFRFEFVALYLHPFYTRENWVMPRRSSVIQEMMTATLNMVRWPCVAGTAVRWKQGTMGADVGHYSPRFCFGFTASHLQLFCSRESSFLRRTVIVIKEAATATTLGADRRPCGARRAIRWIRGVVETGDELNGSRFHVSFSIFYLHLCYSREASYLRRTATAIREAAIATMALDADRGPHEEKIVIRWRRGATSADTEHYGSRFHFEFRAFYLQSFYSREVGYLRRRARATTTRVTATSTTFNTDRRPYEAGTAVQWTWSAMEVTELECSRFRFDSKTFYFQLLYSRKNRCARWCWSDIQAVAGRGSTKIYAEIQWTVGEKLCQVIQRCYYEWGEWIEQAEGSRIEYGLATATATVTTRTTTALDSERQPCEAGTAVSKRWGATSMGSGLEGPRFLLHSKVFYLQLFYSREIGYMRRSTTNVLAIVIRGSTRNFEPRSCGSTERQARWVWFGLQQRTSKSEQDARHARRIETTLSGLEGPRFMFFFKVFYLRLRRFREYRHLQGIEESTANYERSMSRQMRQIRFDLQQQVSKSQRDACNARSIEALPSGLDNPKFSFLLRAFYLRPHRFRKDKVLPAVEESLSYKMSAVRRSGFRGRRVVERLCEVTRTRVITKRWSFEATESSRQRSNIEDSRAGLDSSDFHFDLRTFYLHPCYSREDGRLQRIAVAEQETTTNCEQRTCGGLNMWLLMSGREEDEVSSSRRDGEQYAKTEEGQGWPEQRSRTQCIQGDVDPDTEPKSKVLDRVEAQSLISEGKEDGTSSWVECEELVTKLRKGKFEAEVPFLVLIRTLSTARYRYPGAKEKAIDGDGRLEAADDQDRTKLAPSPVGVEDRSSKRARGSTDLR
ncbi:hypothetical protein M404DRAFT_20122 [Pisolithus tinctorius Marx 270]|uniref:Uncharacterized protein n=1 Tax=Pisolithus tinctorius Marx 270 TaxID=870435 RepID=A0A0C3KRZ7_PISTI|nr:hypothetical protein M404DRAFT_20122 [Pisolithus tinctorius Marx 270]